MKNKNLKIIFTGNDKMFDGLYLSILSIVSRTKSNIDFYFLTGDFSNINPNYICLTKQNETLIKKMILSFNPKSSFNVIDCGDLYLQKCNNKFFDVKHWTPYTNFRLMLDYLKFKGLVLYLDCDILISGDISEAFDTEMKTYEICVCHDIPNLKKKNGKWFNAGSILFNLDVIKKTDYLNRTFQYCINNKLKYFDQDALNTCWTNIRFWDDEYRFNYQFYCRLNKKLNIKNPIINHFAGSGSLKPWQTKKFLRMLKHKKIHTWDNDYAIFFKTKQEKEKQ